MKKTYLIFLLSFCIYFPICYSENWKNSIRIETGYRLENFKQSGHMISPSFHHFKQEIPELGLYQLNVEERVDWKGRLFFKGLVGYGFSFHTQNRARGIIDLLVPPLTANETPQPYDNQADPFNYKGKNIYKTKETLNAIITTTPTHQVQHLYMHKHGGAHTWTIDLALGGTFSVLECQSLEPRIGYIFQSLKANKITTTYFQGVYVGLAMPIIYGNFRFTPDISYAFWGSRNETLDYFCQFGNSYQSLHANKGQVLGFRGSLALEYTLSCQSSLGFIWKYFNFHTGSGKHLKINPLVSWKPHTEWQSQQFLASYTYQF